MALAGRELSTRREISTGDLIQGMVPVVAPGDPPRVVGAAVVAIHVPQRLEAQVRGIAQAFQEYKQLKLLRQPIKGIYILLFLLMTLVIVFSVTWFGLYLARGITVPIQLLAQGTREVAAGNLDYRVTAQADDEVGILVESFNQMTQDLKSSKAQLELAYGDLQAKHAELTERRQYTETVLEAVATGVVSTDAAGIVTTVNRAASRMLALAPTAAVGRHYAVAFGAPAYLDLVTLMQRMERLRAGTVERELQLPLDGKSLTLLTSLTALGGPEGEHLGIVLVFDDLTELLAAQRLAAWREVAQRIAHEIKNPLTPIQLSAQRLRRRLAGRLPTTAASSRSAPRPSSGRSRGCGAWSTSSRASRACRASPRSRPTSTGCSRACSDSTARRTRRSSSARISPPSCPTLDADGDQLKRAVLNLVDNAVEAGATEVAIGTRWSGGAHVEVTVADNGPGIAADLRDRVFLPYFSTKTTGMGLGLPIVHQIVSDHGGRIRVEDNRAAGDALHDRAARAARERPGGSAARAGRGAAVGLGLGDGAPMAGDRILIVDDERGIRSTLSGILGDEGVPAARGGDRPRGPRPDRRGGAGPGHPGHLAAGDGRHRGAGRGQAPVARAAGGHDVGPRHHRDGGEGHEARRLRLRREAPLPREDAPGRRARARARPARAGEPPAPRAHRAGARDHRHQPRHRGAPPPDRHRGPDQRPRPDLRRERRRQGAGRAGHPRPLGAPRPAVRGGELRGHPGRADRVGALRPREGRLHRGDGPPPREVRAGRPAARSSSTRSATCRSGPRPRCCGRSRSRRWSGSAGTSRSGSTCG